MVYLTESDMQAHRAQMTRAGQILAANPLPYTFYQNGDYYEIVRPLSDDEQNDPQWRYYTVRPLTRPITCDTEAEARRLRIRANHLLALVRRPRAN